MGNTVYGGKNIYGYDIGIMMLDSQFPRIIGDVGNAKTWNFPVLYKTVKNATPNKVVLNLTKDDIRPFINAAKELEKAGALAITTSCGFLSLFQDVLVKEVNVPVFTSSLIMLPMVSRMIGNKNVLVLTANSDTLTYDHLEAVCGKINFSNYKIVGTQNKDTFTNFTVENWLSVDLDKCQDDIMSTIEEVLSKDDSYGAILLECTNMPPYSRVIREKYGLPVFDFVTLTNFVHYSLFGE